MGNFFNKLFALAVITVGALWIADVYELVDIDMSWWHDIQWGRIFIPLILIFVGLKMLFKSSCTCNNSSKKDFTQTEGMGKCEVLFAGRDMDYSGQKFTGMNVKTVCGGAKVNLVGADIEDGSVINVETLLGGTEFFVPEDVAVEVNSSCFLGGVGDERKRTVVPATKTLRLNANCMMGGVSIK